MEGEKETSVVCVCPRTDLLEGGEVGDGAGDLGVLPLGKVLDRLHVEGCVMLGAKKG